MQDNQKVEERKFDLVFKHIFHLDESDLRLKFFFDHVRNYGIAASVIVAGFYLLNNGATILALIPYSGAIFGSLLLLFGFLLAISNLLHLIWAMVLFNVKMLPYLLISIIIFLSGMELTWVIIKKTME